MVRRSHALVVVVHGRRKDRRRISWVVVRSLLGVSVVHSLGHSSHLWEVVGLENVLGMLSGSSHEVEEVHVDRSTRRIGHGPESVDDRLEHQDVRLGSAKRQELWLSLGNETHICSAVNSSTFELLTIELLDSRLEVRSGLEFNEAE